MIKKEVHYDELHDTVYNGYSWDNHDVKNLMDKAASEGQMLDKKYSRRVAAIPFVITQKWFNEDGFDVYKADPQEIIKKAKEEGYYFGQGI